MGVGGLLTTQRVLYASSDSAPGLILSIIGGLGLLGLVFLPVALMGLRARKHPGRVVSTVAPKVGK